MRYAFSLAKVIIMSMWLLLAACGGDSDDGDIIGTGQKPRVTINGTAAIGAAIRNTQVQGKTRAGTKVATNSNNVGRFRLELEGEGPYLLRTSTEDGRFLFSIASGSGNTNIHPFTDLIIRNWFEVQGLDLEAEFASDSGISQLPTPEQIELIKQAISNIISLALVEFTASQELDLFKTEFGADGTGFDGFLDHAQVYIGESSFTITVTSQTSSVESSLVDGLALNFDFSLADTQAPNEPQGWRAVPASTTEIIVVWEPAMDNQGIAGYQVFRDDVLVATTPYPVYTDQGLSPNQRYCYTIKAMDGAGLVSRVTQLAACATTDTTEDIVPQPVSQLRAVALDNEPAIALDWVPSLTPQTIGYDIYRGSRDAVTVKVASRVSNIYVDLDLQAQTEYCYQVYAFTATGNTSTAGEPVCATTNPLTEEPPPAGDAIVEFSADNYQVSEDAISIEISVTRSGGLGQPVSVDYMASDISAVQGVDYLFTPGRLSWDANDTKPRSFTVFIHRDGTNEFTETIQLALSNPSEAAVLGARDTAVLNIYDVPCTGRLSISITQDTQLSEPCIVVRGTLAVYSGATLSINPGVHLIFSSFASLEVRRDGALEALGSEAQPILFTGDRPQPGYWQGLVFDSSDNVRNSLQHVIVEYAGYDTLDKGASLSMKGFQPQRVKLNNVVLRNGGGYGFDFSDDSYIDQFDQVTVTSHALAAGLVAHEVIPRLQGSGDFSGNTNDWLEVNSSSLGISLFEDAHWPALKVPYLLSGLELHANLTIDPGAVLMFEKDRELRVSQAGSLTAVGTAESPIVFTGREAQRGYWEGIGFYLSQNLKNELTHVVVEYGGAGTFHSNVLSLGVAQRLKISNSVLRESQGYGLRLNTGSRLGLLDNNTFTANALGAVNVTPDAVIQLTENNDYSGNDKDVINVEIGTLDEATQWPALNVPYSLKDLRLVANLTLAAGAVLQFQQAGSLEVSQTGSLTAIGTADNPIVFTGEDSVAGYWLGLIFNQSNSADNILDHTRVEFGGTVYVPLNGSPPIVYGNINLFERDGVASAATISNSIIQYSEGPGIYLVGGELDPAWETDNTFVENLGDNVLHKPAPVPAP